MIAQDDPSPTASCHLSSDGTWLIATLGPPEIDLAHWMYLDDVFSTNYRIAGIDGIPDEDTAIRGFERIYGWPTSCFSYYLAVAALRIPIPLVRDYSNGKRWISRRLCPISSSDGSVSILHDTLIISPVSKVGNERGETVADYWRFK